MNHTDHVRLLAKGIVRKSGGKWADLGSGTGAFTLALRDIIGPDGEIISVDKSKESLAIQKNALSHRFPQTHILYRLQDFTKPLEIADLDGIIMANSLHYVKNKTQLLEQLKTYLKPNGKLVLVEYNVDSGNYWVPFPLSFKSFEMLAKKSGFIDAAQLDQEPSTFLQEIYSAVAYNA